MGVDVRRLIRRPALRDRARERQRQEQEYQRAREEAPMLTRRAVWKSLFSEDLTSENPFVLQQRIEMPDSP